MSDRNIIAGWSVMLSGTLAEVRAALADVVVDAGGHGDNAAALAASAASLAATKITILAQLAALAPSATVHVLAHGPRPDLHPDRAPIIHVHGAATPPPPRAPPDSAAVVHPLVRRRMPTITKEAPK